MEGVSLNITPVVVRRFLGPLSIFGLMAGNPWTHGGWVGGRGRGGWEGEGWVGSRRQAKPSVRTVWTSYESQKNQP